MLPKEFLPDLLSRQDIGRKEKVLIILGSESDSSLEISQIRDIGASAGLREIAKWNLSDVLAKAKGLVVKIKEGWTLTTTGKAFLEENYLQGLSSSTKSSALSLRKHLPNIKSSDTREFVEEAIRCLETDLYRSAIVMSWVGAVSVLYDYVIANALADFNKEATRRGWKVIKVRDDFTLIKESDFLDVLAGISVLGKNVKEHLKNTNLNLRNSCGHPSSLKLGKHVVEAHIEFLILNVFEKFQ